MLVYKKKSNSVWSVGVVDRHGLSKRSRSRVLLDTGRIIFVTPIWNWVLYL